MIMSGEIVAYVYDTELKGVATLEKEGQKVLTIDFICIEPGLPLVCLRVNGIHGSPIWSV